MSKPRPDWPKLRQEFIHGTESMRELAERHGINAAGVMKRAAKEDWSAERQRQAEKVSKIAGEVLAMDRAKELADFNAYDLRAAKALRAKAAKMLASEESPAGVRALAGSLESAQRIARLALGASTENTDATVTAKGLPASIHEFV